MILEDGIGELNIVFFLDLSIVFKYVKLNLIIGIINLKIGIRDIKIEIKSLKIGIKT